MKRNNDGFILVATMVLLGFLTFLAGSLYTVTKPEVTSAHYYKDKQLAFSQAEAGIRYSMGRLTEDIQQGNIDMSNDTQTVNYSAPEGFTFDPVTEIFKLPDGESSAFIVTGRCKRTRVVLEATVMRPKMLANAGMFGDKDLRLQPNGEIYSYDSRTVANPTPADSTGEANVGSNEGITIQNHNDIDGTVMVGADESGNTPAPPGGYDYTETGRIDPDPLGAQDGALADAFVYYSNPANNDNAAAGITKNELNVKKGSMTLPGGHYYLEDLYLGSKATLDVLATPDDPCIIYLHGPLRAQPKANINVINGLPSNFFIFCDTDDELRLQPHNDFSGFVYAPYAELRFQPQGDLKGVFWGSELRMQPNNDVYIDVSLLDRFRAAQVQLVQWRMVAD